MNRAPLHHTPSDRFNLRDYRRQYLFQQLRMHGVNFFVPW
jgi:hypothetical protein